MTMPIDPTQGKSSPPSLQSGQPTPAKSYLDPTGAWSKFLTGGLSTATPQEVQMFIQGMMKMFNIVIQQQNAAYQRANEQLKKAEKGEE